MEKLADVNALDKDGKKIPPLVKDYDDSSTDTRVSFTITLAKGKLEELLAIQLDNDCNGVEKIFKLYNSGSMSNMHLFDATDKLKKYECVPEIIEDYFTTRLELFETRKQYWIWQLQKEWTICFNKDKYITEILNGTLDLRNKPKDKIVEMLCEKGYDKLDDDVEYKYLVKMPMDSVCSEYVEKIRHEACKKETELKTLIKTPIQQMWFEELCILEEEYKLYKQERTKPDESTSIAKKKIIIRKKASASAGGGGGGGGGGGEGF